MIYFVFFLAMFYAAWAGVCIHWAIEMFENKAYGFGTAMSLLAFLTLLLSTNTMKKALDENNKVSIQATHPNEIDTVYNATNEF